MKQTEYSLGLIAELEELFPDYTEAIKLAKENSPFLKQYIQGSYLTEAIKLAKVNSPFLKQYTQGCSLTAIYADKFILSTSLEDLQKEAFLIKRRINFEKKLLEEHSNMFG